MAVTETTTTSYGTRVKRSAGGIKSGIILFVAGTCLLWWNEGRAVKTATMLEEAQDVAVHVENVENVDPALNGKLIHATANATTKDVLTDTDFGVSATAIKLDRKVEYYQYVEDCQTESKDKLGGSEETTKTYTCKVEWVRTPVNSSSFHGSNATSYKNITLMNFEDKSCVAQNVSFGGYHLNSSLTNGISDNSATNVKINQSVIDKWNSNIRQTMKAQNDNFVHINDNVVYFGRNPNSPQIGDVRVTFTQVNPGIVSILAQVKGDTFESFTAKNGKTLSAIKMGAISMDQMFESEQEANKIFLWILRIVGWIVICMAFKSIFSILSTIFKVVPFVANILNWGVGLVSKVLGTTWSLLIIGIAWIAYRPILAGCILGVAVIITVLYIVKGKNKAPQTDNQVIAQEASAPVSTENN
ncbi:MAG: TMEM43 family protein [Bacteroidales bacterium]|nr:TMEM43 family protein [Bacteroidales bacterium]